MTATIRAIVHIGLHSIWAVVGPFLWIPYVVLTATYFAVSLVAGLLLDQEDFASPAEQKLNAATHLWGEGFRRINRSWTAEATSPTPGAGVSIEEARAVAWIVLFRLTMWAIVFWLAVSILCLTVFGFVFLILAGMF